jgi:dual specificity protein kinase YAK1
MPRGPALIDPCEPARNSGFDNQFSDLIVYAGTRLVDPDGRIFLVESRIGSGHCGQVYRVLLTNPDEGMPLELALKISKSDADSIAQFRYEANVLEFIAGYDGNIGGFMGFFEFHSHVCIVLRMLGSSLLDALVAVEFRGLGLAFVQRVLGDMLGEIAVIGELGLCHCDVKPENVLFEDEGSMDVKLIDFGNCCNVGDEAVQYTQSRYYRAPEVALRLGFDSQADVWSAGCVAAELFLGLPLFPAVNESHLIALIDEMLGPFPSEMVKKSEAFGPDGKVMEGSEPVGFVEYFVYKRLDEIIMGFPGDEKESDVEERRSFLDLLHGMLEIDPGKRLSAVAAGNHPFFRLEL